MVLYQECVLCWFIQQLNSDTTHWLDFIVKFEGTVWRFTISLATRSYSQSISIHVKFISPDLQLLPEKFRPHNPPSISIHYRPAVSHVVGELPSVSVGKAWSCLNFFYTTNPPKMHQSAMSCLFYQMCLISKMLYQMCVVSKMFCRSSLPLFIDIPIRSCKWI